MKILEPLDAKAEAATQGDWCDGDGVRVGFGVWSDGVLHVADTDDLKKGDCDAKFIAAANPKVVRGMIHALKLAESALLRGDGFDLALEGMYKTLGKAIDGGNG